MPGRFSNFHHHLGRRLAAAAVISTAGLVCAAQGVGAYPQPGETATTTASSSTVAPGGTFLVTAKFLTANGTPIAGMLVKFTSSFGATATGTTNSLGVATASFVAPSGAGTYTILATAADGSTSQTQIKVASTLGGGLVPGGPGNTGGGAGAPSGGLPGVPFAAEAGIGALIVLAGATAVVRRRHSATR